MVNLFTDASLDIVCCEYKFGQIMLEELQQAINFEAQKAIDKAVDDAIKTISGSDNA